MFCFSYRDTKSIFSHLHPTCLSHLLLLPLAAQNNDWHIFCLLSINMEMSNKYFAVSPALWRAGWISFSTFVTGKPISCCLLHLINILASFYPLQKSIWLSAGNCHWWWWQALKLQFMCWFFSVLAYGWMGMVSVRISSMNARAGIVDKVLLKSFWCLELCVCLRERETEWVMHLVYF